MRSFVQCRFFFLVQPSMPTAVVEIRVTHSSSKTANELESVEAAFDPRFVGRKLATVELSNLEAPPDDATIHIAPCKDFFLIQLTIILREIA